MMRPGLGAHVSELTAILTDNLHVAPPFLVALLGGALLRLLGRGRGEALGQAMLPAGVVAGWIWLMDGFASPLPGWRALPLLPWLVLLGLLAGLLLDLLGGGRRARTAALAVLAVVASWLLAGRPWPPDWLGLAVMATALAGALVALMRLETRAPMPQTAPVMLTAAALGLYGLAWLAGGGIWQALAAALTAGAAGHLLCGWLLGVRFGAAAVLGGGGALVALAQASVLSGPLPTAPVLLLLLIFFADGTAARLSAGSGLLRRILAPVMLAVVCLLPLALALIAGYVAANLDQV